MTHWKCTTALISTADYLVKKAWTMSESREASSSRQASSVIIVVFNPWWNAALSTGSFQPLSVVRVWNFKTYYAALFKPCLIVSSLPLISFPSCAWSNTCQNTKVLSVSALSFSNPIICATLCWSDKSPSVKRYNWQCSTMQSCLKFAPWLGRWIWQVERFGFPSCSPRRWPVWWGCYGVSLNPLCSRWWICHKVRLGKHRCWL